MIPDELTPLQAVRATIEATSLRTTFSVTLQRTRIVQTVIRALDASGAEHGSEYDELARKIEALCDVLEGIIDEPF